MQRLQTLKKLYPGDSDISLTYRQSLLLRDSENQSYEMPIPFKIMIFIIATISWHLSGNLQSSLKNCNSSEADGIMPIIQVRTEWLTGN